MNINANFLTRTTIAAILGAMLPALHTSADTYVAWTTGHPYTWSASQKWGLDPTCGLYPTRGMAPCCNCSPEDRWFVTVDTSIGPTLDVNPDLVGLNHRTGQITIENHTLIVSETYTLGDGDPQTSPPWLHGPTAGTLISGGIMHITDTNALLTVQTTLNNGVFIADPGVRFSLLGGGSLTNNPGAVMTLHDGCTVDGWGGRTLLLNLGLVQKLGAGDAFVKADFNGNGMLDITGGSVSLERDSQLNGLTTIASGARLKITGGGFSATVGGSITGNGAVEIGDGMIVDVNGILDVDTLDVHTRAQLMCSVPGAVDTLILDDSNGGTFIAGTLTVRDTLDWRNGALKDGTFDILGSGTIDSGDFDNAIVRFDSATTIDIDTRLRGDNGGEIHNDGLVRLQSGAQVTANGINAATFFNNGTFDKMGSDLIAVDLAMHNRGLLRLTGTINQNGDFIQASGETRLEDGTINAPHIDLEFQDGSLTGGGTIAGLAHLQRAMIAPGLVDDGFGNPVMDELIVHELVLDADARSCFKLAGTTRGVDYDTVTGIPSSAYTVGGTLEIRLENGFENTIDQHDTFVIMDSNGAPIAGMFDGIASGQRVRTSRGEGTFIVYYGPSSPFASNEVRLTGFRRSAHNEQGTNAPVGTVVPR